MALVPLDERLKAKERVWEAERGELVSKVEEGQKSVKAVEERCRELEIRRSEMEEERCVIFFILPQCKQYDFRPVYLRW